VNDFRFAYSTRKRILPNNQTATQRCLQSCFQRRYQVRKQAGVAMVELMIALPILAIVALGLIQWALVWEARLTLNYAALQVARAGAMHQLDPEEMKKALFKVMYAVDPAHSVTSFLAGRNAKIQIMNPTLEAFIDFGQRPADGTACPTSKIKDRCEIPVDRLSWRSSVSGKTSDLSIQDASLLKVRVIYGYRMRIPLVNRLISSILVHPLFSPFHRGSDEYRVATGNGLGFFSQHYWIPLGATAIVRMQTPAKFNSLVLSREEVENLLGGLE
jgi:Flp pilus assembly protein TadG